MLLTLPPELVPRIALLLDIPDLVSLGQTCQCLQRSVTSPYFRRLYLQQAAQRVDYTVCLTCSYKAV